VDKATNPTDLSRPPRLKRLEKVSYAIYGQPLMDPSTSTFPFLQLPPELRNKVYRYATLSDGNIAKPTNFTIALLDANEGDGLVPSVQSPSSASRRTNLDILLVCKQLLHEAERIWYAESRFVLGHARWAMRFFDTLGERRRTAITRMELRCCDGYNLKYKIGELLAYLERSHTLMKPQWFVLGLSGNHTPVHVLE
jgi:hypothetical protein